MKPESLTFAQAAALPLTSLTAWELLFDRLRVPYGDKTRNDALLIINGAGGVGSILTQIARQLTGLTVIASASRPETVAWCMQMGAHHVINHRRPLDVELKNIGIPEVRYVAGLTATEEHLYRVQSGFRSAKLQNLLQYGWRKLGRSSVMRNLSKCMLAISLFGASVANAEPITFHTQTFSDQTTVTMALTSSSALLQQEYDFGVTIKLIETDATGSVTFQDNGLHKALVQCHAVPGKIFVGGKEYLVAPDQATSAQDIWKTNLWRAVCATPPIS